jgi:transcription elongation factor GreA
MAKIIRAAKSVQKNYLTPQGLLEAKSELDFLKNVKRPEVSERIQRAIEFGDVSENSEYDAALDEQALIENRISYIESVLNNPKIIQEHQSNGLIVIGSTVVVDIDGSTNEYTIVGKVEADPGKKKISNESPLGTALLGAEVGQEVEVNAPNFSYKAKILTIK